MAKDVLFEVDASLILAKLHLAGLLPCKYTKGKEFIINTGIKNDDPGAKPDNPGNVTFDLKNSSGEYEVGYVTEISYHKPFGIKDAFDSLSKIVNVETNAKINGKLDDKAQKERESLEKSIRLMLGLDDTKLPLSTPKEIDDAKLKAKDILSQKEKDTYEDKKQLLLADGCNILNTYMKVFAGKDNVKTITAKEVLLIEISPNVKDSNDSSLVKLFEIVPISDMDKLKILAQARAEYEKKPDAKNENYRTKMCVKIKYDLTVDK